MKSSFEFMICLIMGMVIIFHKGKTRSFNYQTLRLILYNYLYLHSNRQHSQVYYQNYFISVKLKRDHEKYHPMYV